MAAFLNNDPGPPPRTISAFKAFDSLTNIFFAVLVPWHFRFLQNGRGRAALVTSGPSRIRLRLQRLSKQCLMESCGHDDEHDDDDGKACQCNILSA